MSEATTEQIHAAEAEVKAMLKAGHFAEVIAVEMAVEVLRLRVELRRFQRIVIDHEILTECDDLCMVLCAGPCQGFNTESVADTTKASTE